jgi:hypothetical protein
MNTKPINMVGAEVSLSTVNSKPNNTLSEKDMLKVLRRNKDKNFVKRISDPTTIDPLDNGPGKGFSTHSMSYASGDNKYYVYPTVVEQQGKLIRLGDKEAIDYAIKSGESIEFDDEKKASYFSENYKKLWESPEIQEKLQKKVLYNKAKGLKSVKETPQQPNNTLPTLKSSRLPQIGLDF